MKSSRPYNFRIWDIENKCWCFLETFIGGAYVGLNRDGYIVHQGMNRFDKDGEEIFEGDYVEVETENGHTNFFEVKFGVNRRTMETGAWVEIVGFYFDDPYNPGESGKYSIVCNWKQCNDLKVTKVVGNIFEKPARAAYV